MGTITKISQTVNPGSGAVTATYSCFCGAPNALKNITVTMGNENECRTEAQLECDDYCNNLPAPPAGEELR